MQLSLRPLSLTVFRGEGHRGSWQVGGYGFGTNPTLLFIMSNLGWANLQSINSLLADADPTGRAQA